MPLFQTRPTPQTGMEEVYVAQGILEAEIIKGKLETNGIPTLLKYESLGPVLGLTVDGLGQVQVLVPQAHAELARQLLEEVSPDSDEMAEDDDDFDDGDDDSA